MRTKYKYRCLNCGGQYNYYHKIDGWKCPNCDCNQFVVSEYLDMYDEECE